MSPCHSLVDVGRNYNHYGLIYPFGDAPDVPVRVLWYRIPLDSPSVPYPNVFVLPTWDRLEGLTPVRPGTDYDESDRYFGPTPLNPPGMPCGTPDQWLGQISYATWLAGGYTCNCPEDILPTYTQTVTCDDASINVAPTSGNVVLHVNTSHQNTWIVQQLFRSTVISILDGFFMDNTLLPPAVNQIQGGMTQDESLGLTLSIVTTPLAGPPYHGVHVRLTPNLAGSASVMEVHAIQSSGSQDVFLRLVDATGTNQDGQTGGIPGLFTTYGGIVVSYSTLPGDPTQFLNGTGSFSTPTGGFADPMTSTGDLISSSDNTPTPVRVPPNTDVRTQLLTGAGDGINGNVPAWAYGVCLPWFSAVQITVSNTTTPTSILAAPSSATLWANTASPGTTARVSIDGVYGTTSGSGVWRFNLFLGGTQIGTIGSVPTVGITFGAYFRLRLLLTITATGSSGHAIALGDVTYDHNTGAGVTYFVTTPATGATVDTTTDLLPDVQIVMAAASSLDKVTILNRTLEWLG